MVLNDKNLITCVEFGTASVNVLHGLRDKNGLPVVLGIGKAAVEGAVRKGEIIDLKLAGEALNRALEAADKAAGGVCERRNVYCIINGAGVAARQGEGQVVIFEEDHKIRRSHVQEAIQKAQNITLPIDQIQLVAFDAYYRIDSKHRVSDPLGMTGNRLDAYLHIFSANRTLIENMTNLLNNAGFENRIEFVVSSVASAYGALTREEKEEGVLLVDMGAGVTDYILIHKDGILASGILPVGTENIANDLSIGLDLPIEQCRKMLVDPVLNKKICSGIPFIEVNGAVSGTKRNIPVGSFERIIDLRLTEIFSILRERLDPGTHNPQAAAGVVFCGGGALNPMIRKTLSSEMHMSVRPGTPLEIGGAVDHEDLTCRDTALLGLLKFAITSEDDVDNGNNLGDRLDSFLKNILQKTKNLTEGLKI